MLRKGIGALDLVCDFFLLHVAETGDYPPSRWTIDYLPFAASQLKIVLGYTLKTELSGRRVCSGYNVGESNVWIAIARLLYCFDFDEMPVSTPRHLESRIKLVCVG